MEILRTENIELSFGGLMALGGISIEVEEKEILAVVGPNGAGKSTLFNCINGIYRTDRGEICFCDENITRMPTHRIAAMGVGRIFQKVELFPNACVLENVMVGMHTKLNMGPLVKAFLHGNFRKLYQLIYHAENEAYQILEYLGITKFHNSLVAELPYGIKKLVEIGRALVARPKLILLDEPAVGMNAQEKRQIAKLILDIREDMGITIFLVEHDLNLVLSVADRMYAMDAGLLIASGEPASVLKEPNVVEAFLGGDLNVVH